MPPTLTHRLLDSCSQCPKCESWFPDQKALEEHRETEHPETEQELTPTKSHTDVNDCPQEDQKHNKKPGMQIPGAFHFLARTFGEFQYHF
jgi:hypothetical protein